MLYHLFHHDPNPESNRQFGGFSLLYALTVACKILYICTQFDDSVLRELPACVALVSDVPPGTNGMTTGVVDGDISPERQAVGRSGYFASVVEELEGSGIKFRLYSCCYGTFASRTSWKYVNECLDIYSILIWHHTDSRTEGDMAVREWNTWDDIGDSAGDPA